MPIFGINARPVRLARNMVWLRETNQRGEVLAVDFEPVVLLKVPIML